MPPDGSGPVEDSEGILPVGSKGRLMQELGMCRIPCIVLESKAYSPGDSDGLDAASRPWVRWNQDSDNPTVGWCLVQAARQCHARAVVNDRAYPCCPGEFDRASQALEERFQAGTRPPVSDLRPKVALRPAPTS